MLGIPKPVKEPVTGLSRFKLILIGLVILAALGLKGWYFFRSPHIPTATVAATPLAAISPTESVPVRRDTSNVSPAVSPASPSPTPSMPASFNLAVPFVSQAPLGNWDAVHEDTCEEASMLMAASFIAGDTSEVLNPNDADVSLLSMVSRETAADLGGSISVSQLKGFMTQWFANKDFWTKARPQLTILESPTADAIKAEIRAGHPVIVPLRGREIGNPFYTGDGPLYHMLVIRGYTADTFITNDPGTRHGENYSYPITTLMPAIGDWDGTSPDGGARVLVVSK